VRNLSTAPPLPPPSNAGGEILQKFSSPLTHHLCPGGGGGRYLVLLRVGGFGSDFLASVSSAVLSLGPPALPPPVRASFLPWAPGRSSPPSRGSRFPLVRSSLVFFLLAVGWTRYKKAVAYCACAEMCTWECAGPFEPRFGTLFSTLLPEPVPRPYPGPMYVPMYTPRLDAGYPMYGPSHKCS